MSNPTPLTAADAGTWYDPARDGAGFVLDILDDDDGGWFFSEFFSRRIDPWFKHPVWFSIQGEADVNGALPLLMVVSGPMSEHSALSHVQCGTVVFDRQADGGISAHVEVTGNGEPQFSPAPPPWREVLHLQRAFERAQ